MLETNSFSDPKGYLGNEDKNEYITLNSTIIKAIREKIQIPIKADGSFDLDKQKDLAPKICNDRGNQGEYSQSN